MHQISIDHLRFQMRTGGMVFKASTLVALNVTQQSDRFKRKQFYVISKNEFKACKARTTLFNFQGKKCILKAGRI